MPENRAPASIEGRRLRRAFAWGSFDSWCAVGLAAVAATSVAMTASGDVFSEVGYDALVERLGGVNVPTGFGYGVGQVEASETPDQLNFGPNTANPQFVGKIFTPMTGPFGVSGHATSVGLNAYGNETSIAPGISNIWVWLAGPWATGSYLRTGQGSTPPAMPPAGLRIFNHSWIGTFGSSVNDNEALRRFDFAIQRDNLVAVLGTNNGAGSAPSALMAYGYNGITVGLANGLHCNALTPVGLDGQGRRKPEIVAPESFTSFATPIVSAGAALLLETTDLDLGLAANANADKSIVIKAALLAGTTKRPGWSNGAVAKGPNRGTTSTPLDPLFGADLLNVDRSHLVLTGGERNGSAAVPANFTASGSGWDYAPLLAANSSLYWRFPVWEAIEELSVVATWNRSVATNFSSFNLMDCDLFLWKVDAAGLQSLIGPGGVGVFGSGNVASISAADNIEALYVRDLEPGEYVLEVRRKPGSQTNLPVAVAWYLPKTFRQGDLNGDDAVNATDLALLLGAWGTSGPGDFDGSGEVGPADLAILLGAWTG